MRNEPCSQETELEFKIWRSYLLVELTRCAKWSLEYDLLRPIANKHGLE